MPATYQKANQRELTAILHSIRSSWTDEERERRKRISEARQQWLLSLLQNAAETRAAS